MPLSFIEKNRARMLGHKLSEGAKERLRLFHLGKSPSIEIRQKIRQKLLGKSYLSVEGRKRIAAFHTGEKNWNWKGGITKINKTERQLAMETPEYKRWRTEVFKRDGYLCVFCGETGRLNADHIKPWRYYPELRYEVSNGRTLCVLCHQKTPTYSRRQEIYMANKYLEGGY